MNKLIGKIGDHRLAAAFAALGLLLILFPRQFTGAAPYIVSAALILYALGNLVLPHTLPKLGRALSPAGLNAGRDFVFLVLGGAILVRRGDALAPIGSAWALLSLLEVSQEINEMVETHHLNPYHALLALVSTGLAILLLLDPKEHFTFHVRILGAEMILSVLERRLHPSGGGTA